MRLYLIHDRLPCAFGKKPVLCGETGFQDDLIEGRVSGGLPFDFQEALGLMTVFGFQRLLFARLSVLQVIHFASAIQVEPLFHVRMIRTGRETPLGCYKGRCSDSTGIRWDCESYDILLAVLLANAAF